MELISQKTITVLTVLLFTVTGFAQDFQGKAYYQTKTTMDMSQFGGRDMTPERRKRIEERMKSFLEREYILTFNKAESVYKEEEKLEAVGSNSRGFGRFASSFASGPKYKNVKSKKLLQDQEFFGKQFLIKDSLQPLQWKMTNESKQIGQYMCFKAVATKTVDEFDISSFRRPPNRGEENSEEEKEPRVIEVIAWYTPQVPVNQGPDEYWGLPGLILEVNADRTTILCTKIVLNPEDKEQIKKPKKGKEVSKAAYNDIVTKKMKEMREMFRGRGRGNRGGRRN